MSTPRKKLKQADESEISKEYDYSTLPYDVLIKIFKYLDFKTISYCASLCRRFYQLSNESVIYTKVTFKYNMDKNLLENYLSKITNPKHLTVEYKFCDNDIDSQEDYVDFENYLIQFVNKSGENLTSLHLESCRSENILNLLCNCPNLTEVRFFRCRGSFQSLSNRNGLTKIQLVQCAIPNKLVQKVIENNQKLKALHVADNSNVNATEICETIAKFNVNIEDLHLCEKKQVRAKGLRALGRCYKLRVLELVGGPQQCDPEDSLQQLAAGCPHLEKLSLYGWKKINDENLTPLIHSCTQLKSLDLRGVDITIKSCREAALSLPLLQSLDVCKCSRINVNQIAKLQKDFPEIRLSK